MEHVENVSERERREDDAAAPRVCCIALLARRSRPTRPPRVRGVIASHRSRDPAEYPAAEVAVARDRYRYRYQYRSWHGNIGNNDAPDSSVQQRNPRISTRCILARGPLGWLSRYRGIRGASPATRQETRVVRVYLVTLRSLARPIARPVARPVARSHDDAAAGGEGRGRRGGGEGRGGGGGEREARARGYN